MAPRRSVGRQEEDGNGGDSGNLLSIAVFIVLTFETTFMFYLFQKLVKSMVMKGEKNRVKY